MARSDVQDKVRHAGTAISQSAGAAGDSLNSAASEALDTAVARGRAARKRARKQAAEQLSKQVEHAQQAQHKAQERAHDAAKKASKRAKKARKKAAKKAHEYSVLAQQTAGRKPKRRKGRLLVAVGGLALAGYAVATVRKRQAEQEAGEPGRSSV